MQTVSIIKGEDKEIQIRLASAETGDPYDLTDVTAVTCNFTNTDLSNLALSLSAGIAITTALAGKLTMTLTAAQTALLLLSSNSTMQLNLTKNAKITKVQIPKAFSVIASVP